MDYLARKQQRRAQAMAYARDMAAMLALVAFIGALGLWLALASDTQAAQCLVAFDSAGNALAIGDNAWREMRLADC